MRSLVIAQVPDDRMVLGEFELFLGRFGSSDQLPNHPQPINTVRGGKLLKS